MCKKLFDRWKLNRYLDAQIPVFCDAIKSLNYSDLENVLTEYKELFSRASNADKKKQNVEHFLDKYTCVKNIYLNREKLEKMPLVIKESMDELIGNKNYISEQIISSMNKAIDSVFEVYKVYIVQTNEMKEFKTQAGKYKIIIKLHNIIVDIRRSNESFAMLCNFYISKNDLEAYKDSIKDLSNRVKALKQSEKKTEPYKEEIENFECRLESFLNEKFRKEHNDKFVKDELDNEKNKEIFQVDGGFELDNQQKEAVLKDEDYVIITAGAGSGKTATLTGKVNYLIKRKGIDPKEILLISFTKKATNEIKERVMKLTGCEVDAKTFHALGRLISLNSNGRIPELNKENEKIIDRYFLDLSKRKLTEQMKNIILYMSDYKNLISPTDYDNYEEYINELKYMDLRSLKSKIYKINGKISEAGETMKSLQEVKIADYLFLNGIEYKYEMPYEHNGEYESKDENGKYRKDYKPDFYLVESGIYLEHFGVNKDGRAPWLDTMQEKDYMAGINWKREIHNRFRTKLIETYSWWDDDGLLTERLDKLLEENGIVKHPIDLTSAYNTYISPHNKDYQSFKKMVHSFISLFKTNTEITFDELKKRIKGQYDKEYHVIQDVLKSMFANDERVSSIIADKEKDEETKTSLLMSYVKGKKEFLYRKNNALVTILEDIYEYYESYLNEKGEIDFNDMINNAIESLNVNENVLESHYKYIIIDEYQDIAINRFKLYNLISEKFRSKVTAVGDDWQSIYRFTGSDINLFKDFEKYYKGALLLKIEKTYRNSQELLNISSDFVLKNKAQIQKDLVSEKHIENPIKIYGYSNERMAESMMKAIEDIVSRYGTDEKIMVLGRNNFDINKLICDINASELEIVLDFIQSINPQNWECAKRCTDILFGSYLEDWEDEISKVEKARSEFSNILGEIMKVKKTTETDDITEKITKIMVQLRTFNKQFSLTIKKKANSDDKDEDNTDIYIKYKKYPELEMQYLTVHKSKGMEADNVIVINNENNRVGFPNQIEDEPILQYLLSDQDSYPFAEERRLFYVALTRTKKRTYLLYPIENPSSFITELSTSYNINASSVEEEILSKGVLCPSCNNGWLQKRSSKDGKTFYGCTNFPACRYTINVDSLNNLVLCNKCGYGYFVKREGKYGQFYGCNNYPLCVNSMETDVYYKLVEENGFYDNFKEYIASNFVCITCNKPMQLHRLYNGKLVIWCEICKKEKSITKETYGIYYKIVKNRLQK